MGQGSSISLSKRRTRTVYPPLPLDTFGTIFKLCSVNDMIYFACSCKMTLWIAYCEKLWKEKLFQCLPMLMYFEGHVLTGWRRFFREKMSGWGCVVDGIRIRLSVQGNWMRIVLVNESDTYVLVPIPLQERTLILRTMKLDIFFSDKKCRTLDLAIPKKVKQHVDGRVSHRGIMLGKLERKFEYFPVVKPKKVISWDYHLEDFAKDFITKYPRFFSPNSKINSTELNTLKLRFEISDLTFRAPGRLIKSDLTSMYIARISENISKPRSDLLDKFFDSFQQNNYPKILGKHKNPLSIRFWRGNLLETGKTVIS